MLYQKKIRLPILLLVIMSLLTLGFKSEASAVLEEGYAEEPALKGVEITTLDQFAEESAQIVETTADTATEVVEEKAEEKAKEEEERKKKEAEEDARKQEQEATEKLMAAIIFCEAGNQSYTGQVAVGAVIMNRVKSSSYPDSIEEVIYQKGQFGPAGTGWLDKVRKSGGYTDSALKAARAALAGENPIGNCLYFDQGGKGTKIGAHYFH